MEHWLITLYKGLYYCACTETFLEKSDIKKHIKENNK